MRKTLFLALALMTLVTTARSLEVPEGKAALVQAILGSVKADQGSGFKKIKLGDDLAPGTTVKTGSTGRATFLLPDGSTARVAPNTELTLKEEKVRKGIFSRLLKGTVRFLVAKQTGGASFETELPGAVAAVKGTDPEYGTDGKTSYAKVFSSGNPVALMFKDTSTGKETALKAGEKLSFDGKEFKIEKLDAKDEADSDKNYEGLPPAEKEGEKKTDEEKKDDSTTTEENKDGSDDKGLDEATEEAMREATEELYLDGFLERDERTGDIMAGKILYDRFGQRVQVSHFITREDDSSVSIASFSLRDEGPNRGVSSAIESATFNQPLPEDWASVYKRPLDDPANLDGNGYPIYWRSSQVFLAENPYGDYVLADTKFERPDWLGAQYGALEQGFMTDLYINNNLVYQLSITDPYISGDISSGGIYPQSSFQIFATQLEGGWSFAYNDYTADFLTEDLHFLDDNGNVLLHPTFAGIPALPSVYKGFDANVEVAFHSPLFEGRSIDLLFLPGFFDLYDMFSTGSYDSYNNF